MRKLSWLFGKRGFIGMKELFCLSVEKPSGKTWARAIVKSPCYENLSAKQVAELVVAK